MRHITVGFSIHRPEMVPPTLELMMQHDAIFLEEPETPGFYEMLRGRMSVEEYLLQADVEYPIFSREMCRNLQHLVHAGKRFFQVEPFLSHLIAAGATFATMASAFTPSNVSDLVGARASSGDGALTSRGYVHIDTQKHGGGSYSQWWNPSLKSCLSVQTRDGRY